MFLHGLLLFAILSPWLRRYYTLSPNGSGLPGMGGGGGDGGERYIALAALRPAARPAQVAVETQIEKPVVPPPTEVPTVIPPPTPAPDSVPETKPSQTQGEAGAAGAAAGAGQGGGAGGGTGGGQGPGTGTGVGPGTGGSLRGIPPEQRQLLYPPMQGTPKSLRGKPVTVTFYVSSSGVVDRISTLPELPADGYKRDFEAAMMGFKFRPARDSLNVPVAGIATAVVNLSNQ